MIYNEIHSYRVLIIMVIMFTQGCRVKINSDKLLDIITVIQYLAFLVFFITI